MTLLAQIDAVADAVRTEHPDAMDKVEALMAEIEAQAASLPVPELRAVASAFDKVQQEVALAQERLAAELRRLAGAKRALKGYTPSRRERTAQRLSKCA